MPADPTIIVPCADCGETENDVEHCVGCDRPICYECVAARNVEHGVVWCHECAEREKVMPDYAREQTTYRILIGAIASVIICAAVCLTIGHVAYNRSQAIATQNLPASRVELKGDQPQRFEFVGADGRVVTSIVVRP